MSDIQANLTLDSDVVYKALTEDSWQLVNSKGRIVVDNLVFSKNNAIENSVFIFAQRWNLGGGYLSIQDLTNKQTILFDLFGFEKGEISGKGSIENIDSQFKLINKSTKKMSLVNDIKNKLNNTWWLYRGSKGAIFGKIFLRVDGRIVGYEHPNEFAWGVIDDEVVFYNIHGDVTSSFDKISYKPNGGMFIYRSVDGEETLRLEQLNEAGDSITSQMFASLSFDSHPSEMLLVIINGGARPYKGLEPSWDFYGLPFKYGCDYIRVAENEDFSWYLDKKDLMLGLLGGCVGRYKKVAFVGASAGGFASILYSEILAQYFKETTFSTFVANPQTTHTDEALDYLSKNFDMPQRGLLISKNRLSQIDRSLIAVDRFVQNECHNLKHHVYYDSLNPVEVFYSGQIAKFSRVHLNHYQHNLAHHEAIGEIFKTGDMERDITVFWESDLNAAASESASSDVSESTNSDAKGQSTETKIVPDANKIDVASVKKEEEHSSKIVVDGGDKSDVSKKSQTDKRPESKSVDVNSK